MKIIKKLWDKLFRPPCFGKNSIYEFDLWKIECKTCPYLKECERKGTENGEER